MMETDLTKGTSVIHRLDPRVKIVGVAGLSIIIALCSNWTALLLGFFISFSFMMFSRLPFIDTLVRLLMLNGLMLFFWLILPFSYEGEPLFTIGPLIASREGILFTALLTFRSNIIILACICLVSTTPIFTLGFAMRQLRCPNKVVQLFFFTYRYVHVIHLEYQRLLNALKIRGFKPGTNLRTYRTYAYLVGLLLVRSYDRSLRIRNAMLCRGFRGRFYSLNELTLKRSDLIILFLILVALCAVILLQWTAINY